MQYKVNLKERLSNEKNRQKKLKEKPIVIGDLLVKPNTYSKADETLIVKLLNEGFIQKQMASKLNRIYYGIVDKIRRMKKEGKFPS